MDLRITRGKDVGNYNLTNSLANLKFAYFSPKISRLKFLSTKN